MIGNSGLARNRAYTSVLECRTALGTVYRWSIHRFDAGSAILTRSASEGNSCRKSRPFRTFLIWIFHLFRIWDFELRISVFPGGAA